MRMSKSVCVAGFLLAMVVGCGSGTQSGAVQLVIGEQEAAATESSVVRIQVVVSGADFADIQQDLVKTGSAWGGTIDGIPAGTDRTLTVKAFAANNGLEYQGQATGVAIVGGETALVAVTLHDMTFGHHDDNDVPIIDSVSVSSSTVVAGEQLTLGATAHDPVPNDLLSYSWSATAGQLSSTTVKNPTWTAPTSPQTVTLTLTVRDQRNGVSTARLTVEVIAATVPGGSATVSVSFNRPPLVLYVHASEGRVVLGQSTAVVANVVDQERDPVTYQWSATCAGTFSTPTGQSSSFTPTAVPSGACNNCNVTMTARDSRGGVRSGSVRLCVVSSPAP
ncbi:PKD domain-containing protein [Myxococcus sp. K38C18041901]|uniref:PKD domain-containing protein n=1 Tax=Myxococcus guangdongensis TaxID=2906760 RepID=UPI0020A7789F|nr:PKD domain-containing protein [Myxococcus guangdongensis]MCP3064313.1 PKD domain-containing protein [Myxococcus guangdongensis]